LFPHQQSVGVENTTLALPAIIMGIVPFVTVFQISWQNNEGYIKKKTSKFYIRQDLFSAVELGTAQFYFNCHCIKKLPAGQPNYLYYK